MRPFSMRFRVRELMAVVAFAALLTAWVEAMSKRVPHAPAFRPVNSSVVQQTIRFAVMPPETVGQHVWSIANDGRAPLQVFYGCSGFDCRVRGTADGRDDLKEDRGLMIPPGGKADIVIEWRTGKALGRYTNYVLFGTNDPRFPEIRLRLEGCVEPRA